MNQLPYSTFTRVFIGITVTAAAVLALTQIISYLQIKNSFDLFATKQVIVLKQIGENVLIKENYTLPADFEAFINDYRHQLSQQVLIAFSVGVALSLIAGLILSQQITRPIFLLKRTIREVARSHYQIRAPETGSSEIRELIHSFNGLIQELENQETMRQELLQNLTHELKTPITKIHGQIEGMLDGIYPLTPKSLQKVAANIAQLEYLIQRLYEINLLTPQDVNLNLSKCPVRQIVTEAISGVSGKPINFEVNIPTNLVVMADKHRFRQIVDNLIANAYKFTPSGTISVSADRKHLSVTDTGQGINPEDLPHIFERLYRAEKSRNRQSGGLGLGLYIVKQLVTLHGWSVSATSKLNQGTTIVIDWRS